MSGGFFRGTTADQDTRFSNKHAKLLKSHKFPPELEHLVDMTKVKMDVMRPWIAHRVTELLGFEDEVLINFIYGLLEEKKVVNGKEIQISLTGFMEKNTGKFMKELWTHLLSAQQNASGVPQQFLDAKEEETRKKQEDTDRIARELKKTREKEGQEREERAKMDREAVDVKAANLETHSRRRTKFSSKWSADDKGTDETNGSKETARNSRSPRPVDRSISPPRGRRSRSVSKSVSSSRSRSRSRSLSASPKALRRSVSAGRRSRSFSRRSSTPSPAPLRGQSPSPARRRLRSPSPAPSRRRSPSPSRRRLRSPARHGSRSPAWRRSRSPMRRRSPISLRRRSRSPIYRRSRTPIRRRSRSPIRRRSRSPVRRRSRSPVRRRSRSPVRRRSRTPIKRRSPSPFQRRPRSPYRRRSPSPFQRRPRSPYRHRSESSASPYPAHSGSPPVRGRFPSPTRRHHQRAPSSPHQRSPSIRRRTAISRRQRSPSPGSRSSSPSGRKSVSPTHGTPPSYLKRGSPKRQQRSPVKPPRDGHRMVERNAPDRQAPRKETAERPISGRSFERDSKGRRISHNGEPVSDLPYNSPSRSASPPAAGRSPSQERSPIPLKRQRESMTVKDRLDRGEVDERNLSRVKEDRRENKVPVNDKRDKDTFSPDKLAASHPSGAQVQKEKSKNDDGRRDYPELSRGSGRTHDLEKGYKADEMNQEAVNLPKVEKIDQRSLMDSGSEESDRKRKHKRSKRKGAPSDEDTSHDSPTEDRKEAKRRRKEEKRLRKEEKYKRREERRQRKEKRRSEKQKLKADRNASPSSDFDKSHDSHDDSTLSDQKKLEIELREKALESLRAKKGAGR